MIVFALITASLAGPVEGYRQQAALALPEGGAVLIDPDSGPVVADPGDVIVLDGAGAELPWTMLSSEDSAPREWRGVPWEPVGAPPDRRRIRIDTRTIGHPVDTLRVQVSHSAGLSLLGGAVTIGGGDWALPIEVHKDGVKVAEGLLWDVNIAHEKRRNELIEVPELEPGVYELLAPVPVAWRGVHGSWGAKTEIPTREVSVDVKGPYPRDAESSVYEVELPAWGLEPRAIHFEVGDERFLRRVEVSTLKTEGVESWGDRLGYGAIERLQLGGAQVDHIEVPLSGVATRHLQIVVQDGRDLPLDIRNATVELSGHRFLVNDAGQGPHRLLSDPVIPDLRTHDLEHARIELLDALPPQVAARGWSNNPGFDVAAVVDPGLLVGAPAVIREFEWVRELEVPQPGQSTRWQVPDAMLAELRGWLMGVRVVNEDGDQVPYLVESAGHSQRAVALTRIEEGNLTRLEIALLEPSMTDSLVLKTDSRTFSREVRVTERSAEHRWSHTADDGPARRVVPLGSHPTETLTVLIHNGDDRALGEIEVEVWGPDVAVVAVPTGPVSLYYGGNASAASYDLNMVGSLISRGSASSASMGPALEVDPVSPGDRRIGLIAVVLLALGLLVLAVRLVLAPMPGDEGEE